MKLFANCAPGVEPFVAGELRQLGFSPSPPIQGENGAEKGGIEFEGSSVDVYRANLSLRTASRVLVRLGSFYASGFPELRRKVSRLPWEEYLTVGRPLAIRATCHASRLYHQGAVAERVAGAISDRLEHQNPLSPPCVKRVHRESIHGSTSSPRTDCGDPMVQPQLILVRLVSNHCTISIDSSGELLHRRGYRLATAKAPLRETLAAVMLIASGWDRTSPLLDPFCGSGTIAIEAALMACRIPPGRGRHFAFMEWPAFNREAWETLLSEIPQAHRIPSRQIRASDRDAGAIRAAQANAERAGVFDCIDFSCHAVSSIDPPPGPGWVVTNPPYGKRTETNQDLRNLYAQFGKVLRARCPGWRVAALCTSVQLLRCTELEWDQGIPFINGGIRVRLVRGTVAPGQP